MPGWTHTLTFTQHAASHAATAYHHNIVIIILHTQLMHNQFVSAAIINNLVLAGGVQFLVTAIPRHTQIDFGNSANKGSNRLGVHSETFDGEVEIEG